MPRAPSDNTPSAAFAHPEMRAEIAALRDKARLAAFKALAHAADPQRYPLTLGARGVEDGVLSVVSALGRSKKVGAEVVRRAHARVLTTLTSPTSEIVGLAAARRVSLRATEPVEAQLRVSRGVSPTVTEAPARALTLADGKFTFSTATRRPPTIAIAPAVTVRAATPSDIDGNAAIALKHKQLGGDAGVLGAATGPVDALPDRQGRKREFARGTICWGPRTGAFALTGLHRARWAETGGATGPLGYPTTDLVHDEGTDRQSFEHGAIHKNSFGLHAIYGRFPTALDAAAKLGVSLGRLKSSVTRTEDGQASYVHFENGAIYERLNKIHTIYGALWELWLKTGLERGALGHLAGSVTVTPHPLRSDEFLERSIPCENGTIYQWNRDFFGAFAKDTRKETPLDVAWIDRRLLPAWLDQGGGRGGINGSLRFPLDLPHMRNSDLVQRFEGGDLTLSPGRSSPTTHRPMSRVELRLRRVKCENETEPRWGEDEIGVGVVWLDPAGNAGKTNGVVVARGLDSGEESSDDRVLCSFDLKALPAWPQTCFATVTFYEEDGGGINDSLADLLRAAQSMAAGYVQGIVEAAAFSLVGDVVVILGLSVGSAFAGIVGAFAAAVVYEVFDAIIGAIGEAFDDDVFPPSSFSVMATDARSLFVGGYDPCPIPCSRVFSYEQRAHGGRYRFTLEWRSV